MQDKDTWSTYYTTHIYILLDLETIGYLDWNEPYLFQSQIFHQDHLHLVQSMEFQNLNGKQKILMLSSFIK